MKKERLSWGLVQVYTGNGKGKTTAALGLALRAAGHRLKVYILQFMKGDKGYGEVRAIKLLAPFITIKQSGLCTFVDRGKPSREDIRLARQGLETARKIIKSGKYDLVILDEINCALDYKLIKLEDVMDLIAGKPPCVELVLTGRNAHKKVIARADLVTEMKEIKHYYRNRNISSRKGIEF
ncbi:MAG: cob(I)yrinic acid a,c-diamide adenosyltransferase [Candidatus Schekmanbacteria bacterium RBG_16_38_11]|uniref:Cob(I)yrinic acid a,c-diamide adenosyltransferase n=1 Tax=Candidatus Schekmanbacteria bacterium RBG_16_38_11 TaxID=1817880 RepID=A0A1F7RSM9_9BACT|nr:MAG: cob(I)yrinic acid a,c-diamide adenosyltransferase [Candidatus Schekmanbacteria bacterium RBG_16_38_11]